MVVFNWLHPALSPLPSGNSIPDLTYKSRIAASRGTCGLLAALPNSVIKFLNAHVCILTT